MKQKLLKLPPNVWYSLVDRTDKEQILTTIKQLQEDREPFRLNDDETKFQLLSSDLFDLKEEQGYSVVKVGRSENLMYNGKLLAIR